MECTSARLTRRSCPLAKEYFPTRTVISTKATGKMAYSTDGEPLKTTLAFMRGSGKTAQKLKGPSNTRKEMCMLVPSSMG